MLRGASAKRCNSPPLQATTTPVTGKQAAGRRKAFISMIHAAAAGVRAAPLQVPRAAQRTIRPLDVSTRASHAQCLSDTLRF